MSNFYVWIEDNQLSDQVQDSSEFQNDAQRIGGFRPGTDISSKVVNTALRSASVVTAALMNALNIDDVNLKSNISTISNRLQNGLRNLWRINAEDGPANASLYIARRAASYNEIGLDARSSVIVGGSHNKCYTPDSFLLGSGLKTRQSDDRPHILMGLYNADMPDIFGSMFMCVGCGAHDADRKNLIEIKIDPIFGNAVRVKQAPRSEEEVARLKEVQDVEEQLNNKVDSFDLRIQNNEQDISTLLTLAEASGTFIVYESNETGRALRCTANVENIVDDQNAKLLQIGGKAVRYDNYIPYPYNNGTQWSPVPYNQYGITINDYNGKLVLNGTANNPSAQDIWVRISPKINCSAYDDMILSGCIDGSDQTYGLCINMRNNNDQELGSLWNYDSIASTRNANENMTHCYIYIRVRNGVTLNNVVIEPRFIQRLGSCLEWQTPFTGLKYAKFYGLKSTGRNLLKMPYIDSTKTQNGITFTVNDDGSITITGTSTGYAEFNINTFECIAYPNYCWCYKTLSSGSNDTGRVTIFGRTINPNGTTASVSGDSYGEPVIVQFARQSNIVFRLYIAEGQTINRTILPFVGFAEDEGPDDIDVYSDESIEIPEGLELGAYDTFEPETGKITRQTATMTLNGSESWGITQTTNGIYFALYASGQNASDNALRAFVSNNYASVNSTLLNVRLAKCFTIFPSSSSMHNYLRVIDYDYSTLEAFKAHLANDPLTIIYKTASPISVEYIEPIKSRYRARLFGSESLIHGTDDNIEYGAFSTYTSKYFEKV